MLLRGSCLTLLPVLAASGWRWHAAVGDPPYGLDFLGYAWDRGDGCVAHDPATWRALASCGLPGAHALMMHHGTTYHRMASAMEAAGFVPRHLIPWLYATGRCQAQRVMEPREVDGKRTMVTPEELEGLAPLLAPGCEPAFLGRLPLEAGCSVVQNLRRHGTGALRVAAVRQARAEGDDSSGFAKSRTRNTDSYSGGMHEDAYAPHEGGRYPKDVVHDGSPEVVAVFDRQGTRYSRKREEGNVDNAEPSYRKTYGGGPRKKIEASNGSGARYFPEVRLDGDEGDAWRYEPKPKGGAREASGGHPTPKPLPLVRWQVRMVTCFPGQWVVDPFLGSGTTMRAALDEGMRALGIELDEVTAGGVTVCTGYCATIARRCPEVVEHVVGRALAELRLHVRLARPTGPGDWFDVLDDDYQDEVIGSLRVVREPAGEATARDPIGKALGLTLDEHRVQLHRAHLEVDLAPGAPPDLADRFAELAEWPEVQALLCRRGDLLDPSA